MIKHLVFLALAICLVRCQYDDYYESDSDSFDQDDFSMPSVQPFDDTNLDDFEQPLQRTVTITPRRPTVQRATAIRQSASVGPAYPLPVSRSAPTQPVYSKPKQAAVPSYVKQAAAPTSYSKPVQRVAPVTRAVAPSYQKQAAPAPSYSKPSQAAPVPTTYSKPSQAAPVPTTYSKPSQAAPSPSYAKTASAPNGYGQRQAAVAPTAYNKPVQQRPVSQTRQAPVAAQYGKQQAAVTPTAYSAPTRQQAQAPSGAYGSTTRSAPVVARTAPVTRRVQPTVRTVARQSAPVAPSFSQYTSTQGASSNGYSNNGNGNGNGNLPPLEPDFPILQATRASRVQLTANSSNMTV